MQARHRRLPRGDGLFLQHLLQISLHVRRQVRRLFLRGNRLPQTRDRAAQRVGLGHLEIRQRLHPQHDRPRFRRPGVRAKIPRQRLDHVIDVRLKSLRINLQRERFLHRSLVSGRPDISPFLQHLEIRLLIRGPQGDRHIRQPVIIPRLHLQLQFAHHRHHAVAVIRHEVHLGRLIGVHADRPARQAHRLGQARARHDDLVFAGVRDDRAHRPARAIRLELIGPIRLAQVAAFDRRVQHQHRLQFRSRQARDRRRRPRIRNRADADVIRQRQAEERFLDARQRLHLHMHAARIRVIREHAESKRPPHIRKRVRVFAFVTAGRGEERHRFAARLHRLDTRHALLPHQQRDAHLPLVTFYIHHDLELIALDHRHIRPRPHAQIHRRHRRPVRQRHDVAAHRVERVLRKNRDITNPQHQHDPRARAPANQILALPQILQLDAIQQAPAPRRRLRHERLLRRIEFPPVELKRVDQHVVLDLVLVLQQHRRPLRRHARRGNAEHPFEKSHARQRRARHRQRQPQPRRQAQQIIEHQQAEPHAQTRHHPPRRAHQQRRELDPRPALHQQPTHIRIRRCHKFCWIRRNRTAPPPRQPPFSQLQSDFQCRTGSAPALGYRFPRPRGKPRCHESVRSFHDRGCAPRNGLRGRILPQPRAGVLPNFRARDELRCRRQGEMTVVDGSP